MVAFGTVSHFIEEAEIIKKKKTLPEPATRHASHTKKKKAQLATAPLS